MKSRNFLRGVFLIDALISIGFGLYSFFAPLSTFGTIVSIPQTNNELLLATLSSMSVLYVLIGLVALIGAKAKPPINTWIGAIMILRHAWLGIMKINDIRSEWLIGDPYPDIIIRGLFVLLYLTAIFWLFRKG